MLVNISARQVPLQDPYAKIRQSYRDLHPVQSQSPDSSKLTNKLANASASVSRLAAKTTSDAQKTTKDMQNLGHLAASIGTGYAGVAKLIAEDILNGPKDTPALKESSQKLSENIWAVPGAVVKVVDSAMRTAVDATVEAVESTAEATENVAKDIGNTAKDVVDKVVDTANDAGKAISNAWNSLWD